MRHLLLLTAFSFLLASAMAAERGFDPPSITPAGGDYSLSAVVRVSIRSEPGTVVIYTLDGTNPAWNNGTMAESNLVFFNLPPGDVVVRAAAFKPGLPRGPVREAKFFRSGQ